MTDYTPPSGPPPPKVPEGWKAVWNAQYSEWFYVNIYTKQSQWDRPTEPVYPPGESAPDGPPPSYAPSRHQQPPASDKSQLGTNNPYASRGASGTSPGPSMSEDERLARQLQEEEDARARGGQDGFRGEADSYYTHSPQPGQYGGHQNAYPQQAHSPMPEQTQDRGKKGGLLGKLLGKASGHSSSHGPPPQQQTMYGAPNYGPAPGGYYGGAPQYGGYGGHPGYGGQPGYYPQQPMHGGRRPGGGGMGVGGAAALGAGGGLLGGMMLGSAMGGDGGDTYIENNYGDDGGDFDGGGDMGDMGGDF